ncbi:hypothetical protein N7510_004488 [Penicillium lagena]|uniref:uncharacterized protein n=1 Tax=Penicillium lagena TaxID=94218 RepID=UPI002540B384|nr:uncharacterized protein N7510_004488 [Penicillium lagena]KAJ5620504.1 hypothetical protein N7510_004488 [Penicillium lagena]
MEYERSAAEGWSLPYYGRENPAAGSAPTPAPAPAPGPKTKTAPPNQARKIIPKTTSGKSRGVSQPTRGLRVGATYYARRGSQQAPSRRMVGDVFRDSPAKSRWRAGMEPDGEMKLPDAFGRIRHAFVTTVRSTAPSRTAGRSSTVNWRADAFDAISHKTGAYVLPANYGDQVIQIWGGYGEVTAAKELLQAVITRCMEPKLSLKQLGYWSRVTAYKADRERDVDMRAKRLQRLQELRKAPSLPNEFEVMLMFLWPPDGPAMNGVLGGQLEKLDNIRTTLDVHVYQQRHMPNYICVSAHDKAVLLQVIELLCIIWREFSTKSDVRLKLYLVEPPSPAIMRTKIFLEKSSRVARPFLHGGELGRDQIRHWSNEHYLILLKNDSLLLRNLQKSLDTISIIRGHLKMRVHFGTFVLDEYRRSEKGESSYEFQEFQNMILHEQAKGRLVPGLQVGQSELLDRCLQASEFLEPLNAPKDFKSLAEIEPTHSAYFEFPGNNNTVLCLEAEFLKTWGARRFEAGQCRWFKADRKEEYGNRLPLQVSVIDFGRSDWQLEIKSFEFHDADSIGGALRAFIRSIRFQNQQAVQTIASNPRRNVHFMAEAPVSKIVEKAALRFQVKGTRYIFELARFDAYMPLKTKFIAMGSEFMVPHVHWQEKPTVSWAASVFAPEWDNVLGENANLRPGNTVEHRGNLSAFFPPGEGRDEDSGFCDFLTVVRKIADMLGPTQHVEQQCNGDVLDTDLGTLF